MIPYKPEPSGALQQGIIASHSPASAALVRAVSRRSALRRIGLAGLSLFAAPALADELVKLPLPVGPRERPMTHNFPQKGGMILQRTRDCLQLSKMIAEQRWTPARKFLASLS